MRDAADNHAFTTLTISAPTTDIQLDRNMGWPNEASLPGDEKDASASGRADIPEYLRSYQQAQAAALQLAAKRLPLQIDALLGFDRTYSSGSRPMPRQDGSSRAGQPPELDAIAGDHPSHEPVLAGQPAPGGKPRGFFERITSWFSKLQWKARSDLHKTTLKSDARQNQPDPSHAGTTAVVMDKRSSAHIPVIKTSHHR